MKSSFIKSVFKEKCPACLSGDVFLNKKIYNLKTFDKMHDKCSNCGHKYELEPGFWYGAMYVNYALSVFFSLFTYIFLHVFFSNLNVWISILSIVLVLLLMVPITFRKGRLIWMNFFTKHKQFNKQTHEQV
ncbi:MAG: DUF983 domain-containing protein [Flavobacteriia bacterium]|nr:DUF983 domain-containing protein [Flavobacteriia bacterium]